MQEKEFVEKWHDKLSDPVTIDELPMFLEEVLEDAHDYGSIAVALGYGAVVTARAMDRSTHGGITGSQAGYAMWKFVREWMYRDNKCGLKILDFDMLLYPQCEHYFSNTISESNWKLLQEEAQKRLDGGGGHSGVVAHWKRIANGELPFGFVVKD